MLLMIAKGNTNGEKCNACYRTVADFPHGVRSKGLRSHWRVLQAPDAIRPVLLWSTKRWPLSEMGKGR